MAFGTLSVDRITDSEGSVFSPSSVSFRNRIINGDMRIDQRNAGAAVSNANGYVLDRWTFANGTDGQVSVQQDSSAPVGFSNSAKVTTTTADGTLTTTQNYAVSQLIEGFNVADLMWGTANAKTVTVSFWVRSSLTGTFGGSLRNSAVDRSYPFTYSISAADTWEYKTVTVAGDTTGTWLTTNGVGIRLTFSIGAGPDRSGTAGAWNSNNNVSVTGAVSVIGTLNATWYITAVQLEVGSVATPFERRPYGTELSMCQRYYQRNTTCAAVSSGTAYYYAPIPVYVPFRAAPTVSLITGTNKLIDPATGDRNITSLAGASSTATLGYFVEGVCSTTTSNKVHLLVSETFAASAEL